jgi:hypothetical protein
MKESYQESMRKVVSAEYKEILSHMITTNQRLTTIDDHLRDLNSKTASHSRCIKTINEWISAHDAVKDVLDSLDKDRRQAKFEKIKNNIAIAGLLIVAAMQIIQML